MARKKQTNNIQTNSREHAGELVKNMQNIHDKEWSVVFNLHENTFFQKIVNKEVLEKGYHAMDEEAFVFAKNKKIPIKIMDLDVAKLHPDVIMETQNGTIIF